MNLATAQFLADRVLALLTPACAEALVVGSVRRGADLPRPEREGRTVHDLELAVVPRAAVPVFGEPAGAVNRLEARVAELLRRGELRRPAPSRRADGPRQKRLLLPEGVEVELWIADVSGANFGVIAAIRTGDRDFARALVTERRARGLLPDGWMVEGGWLWPFRLEGRARERLTRANAPVPPLVCRDEAAFFRHLGIAAPPAPGERTLETARRLRDAAIVQRLTAD